MLLEEKFQQFATKPYSNCNSNNWNRLIRNTNAQILPSVFVSYSIYNNWRGNVKKFEMLPSMKVSRNGKLVRDEKFSKMVDWINEPIVIAISWFISSIELCACICSYTYIVNLY